MLDKPLLSVVIPTLNRAKLLRQTLSRILLHYPIGDPRVEFVIVDNASDELLDDHLSDLFPLFSDSLKLVRFDERVDIIESFKRCVSCVNGDFVQIFGDDDYPCGYIGYQILDCISHRSVDLIYLNRFIGDSSLSDVSEIAHSGDVSTYISKLPLSDFIDKYNHSSGFITSLIFSRASWFSGLSLNRKEYPGYTFLDFLFRSPQIKFVYVFGEPSIIQRRGVQTWKLFWPLYWYVGMGRLLSDLDRDNISNEAFSTWLNTQIKFKNHIVDLLIARSRPDIYKPFFWKYVRNLFRERFSLKVITLLIACIPPSVCILILSRSPNRSKYGKVIFS